jgi:hypothetical protein
MADAAAGCFTLSNRISNLQISIRGLGEQTVKLYPDGSDGGPCAAALRSLYNLHSNYFETGAAGSLSTGDLAARFSGGGGQLLEVSASVGTAPTGSPLVLDVLLSPDGLAAYKSLIGPGGLSIPAGSTEADLTTFARTDLPDGGLVKFSILSVGNSVAGSDLRIGIVVGPF